MLLFLLLTIVAASIRSQTIKQLNEISLKEELPVGSTVTFLTDKIPNLDQSLEYDLVTPLSTDLDLFAIDHAHHALVIKRRIDFEHLCATSTPHHCLLSISIAVSNQDTIDVYLLPIQLKNIDDNAIQFPVNRTVIDIAENDDDWPTKTYPLPQATDADGDPISYSLYLQNWTKPVGCFDFDEKNFVLRPLRKFDREEQQLYVLRLVAHNQFERDVSIDVLVRITDVNDHPPRCEHQHTVVALDSRRPVSLFVMNVTDDDEGDNGRLEYRLINTLPGFSLDRTSGQIRFDASQWLRTNQSQLIVDITDHGQPVRLSTQCIVEFQWTFAFDIHLKSNDTDLTIDDVNQSLGEFVVFDRQEKKFCLNCSIRLNSSLSDLVVLNSQTNEIHLNLSSIPLIRILSNHSHDKESLPLSITVDVWDSNYASIRSSKTFSLLINFHKRHLITNSNVIFLTLSSHLAVNEKIPIGHHQHPCLTQGLSLTDPTDTFNLDDDNALILKKQFHIDQQQNYELTLHSTESNLTDRHCSVELRVHVYSSYSTFHGYPYFSQPFFILTSHNLSAFDLPSLPSYVEYASSEPNDISIDARNGSITIRSPSIFTAYSHDFRIEAVDTRTPSLTCSIPVRIFFGRNQQPPRLTINLTRPIVDLSSGSIEADDPDLSATGQTKLIPPSIEYALEPSPEVDVDRYSGRLFLKQFNRSRSSSAINITVIMTDFGQPERLVTRQQLLVNLAGNSDLPQREISTMFSSTFLVVGACLIAFLILFVVILLTVNCCCCCCQPSRRDSLSSQPKSWKNISLITPDTRLIDHEYVTTSASLPRAVHRVYPTLSYEYQRDVLSNGSLDRMHFSPPTETIYAPQAGQQSPLSMNDINKYLERFEKIYNNTAEQPFRDPVGSVV